MVVVEFYFGGEEEGWLAEGLGGTGLGIGRFLPVVIDDATDVDEVVGEGGVAVGHDLGAIGRDNGGAGGQMAFGEGHGLV